MVKNGLLTNSKIGSAVFAVDLIPTSNKKARPGYPMTPKYITVHNTGNSSKGAGADSHTKYVNNVDISKSWHFTVDEKKIYQELPVTENAWHAGDGNGPGNRSSIGIEICENIDGDWKQARRNAILLIVVLLDELNLTPDKVVPHKHWSGKYCPHKILDEGWDKFLAEVKEEYNTYKGILENAGIQGGTIIAGQPEVSPWAEDAWEKARKKICKDGKPLNDGLGAKNMVTEEQLMVFFDKLGLLD